MKFVDLDAQKRVIEDDLRLRMERVLAHQQFIGGPEIAELEERLARIAGRRFCVCVANGTDAIVLGLRAMGLGPGDAVLTTPFTFVASTEAIVSVGATPIFVDIDRSSMNIDPSKLEFAIKQLASRRGLRPAAVLAVDIFGHMCDFEAISGIAERHGLQVIEDGAQSFGAIRGHRRACSFGRIATTSFFPSKPLGCYGDGGAVFCDGEDDARVVRSLSMHGKGDSKYDHVRVGQNSRLDTLQAAVLLSKLGAFESELESRHRLAIQYTQELQGFVVTPSWPTDALPAWAQYSVRSSKREAICRSLSACGIPWAIHYDRPVHLQAAYRQLGGGVGDFPVAEETCNQVVSLPMHGYVQENDRKRVVAAVVDALR